MIAPPLRAYTPRGRPTARAPPRTRPQVGALKLLGAKLFDLDASLVKVMYREPGDFPIAIDDEMRALSFYSLGENHEVLFDEPDHDDGGRKLF